MNMNQAFPSKYLKADADVPEDGVAVLTIERVEMEEVGMGKDASEKPVVYFEEVEKGMVLNKTNSGIISKLYGFETDDWVGKRVGLFSTDVQFQGDMVRAIRVKARVPAAPRSARAQAASAARPMAARGPMTQAEADAATATSEDDDIPF